MSRSSQPLILATATIVIGVFLGVGVAFNNVYVVVLVPAIVALSVAFVRPRATLLLMVAYIPLENFVLKWLPGGASGALSIAPEIILFFAAASAFLSSTGTTGYFNRQRWVLWIVAFLAVGTVSAWLADVPWIDSVYWIRTNVRYMSAALIIGALGDRKWWVSSFVPVVAGGLVAQFVIAVIEFVGGTSVRLFFAPASMVVGGREFVDYAVTGPAGISGTLGFYNNFGLYSVIAAAICAGAVVAISGSPDLQGVVGLRRVRLMEVAVVAGALNVLLSGSRQSVIVFAAAAIAMMLVVGIRRAGRRIVAVGLALMLFAAAAFLAPSLTGPLAWIPARFGQVIGGAAVSQSLQTDRLFAVARVVPRVVEVSPLLGLGPGFMASLSGVSTAASALSLSSEGVSYVQDVGWAGVFVQVGLVGVGLMLTLLILIAGTTRRMYREGALDRGASATVAGVLTTWGVGMVASSPLLVRSTSLLLWCAVGLCLGGYRQCTDEVDSSS